MTEKTALKVGFYGGSFDPIHHGHINLLIELKEFHQLDEIWICPAYISPFKGMAATSSKHRLEMVKLAVWDLPEIKVSDCEIQKKTISYTIDTLSCLAQEASRAGHDIQLHLLLGDDALEKLADWKDINLIVQNYPILIGRRSKKSPPHLPFPPPLAKAVKAGFTETAIFDISSTKIRGRLQKKLYCGHLLPTKVLDYINFHQLYS